MSSVKISAGAAALLLAASAQAQTPPAAKAEPFAVGAGSHALFSYTNDANPRGASTMFRPGLDRSNVPLLAIERNAAGGNPANQSNETLFVGTHLNLQSRGSWTWGISNQMQIDHNAGSNGAGAYGEALRSDCEIASTIEQAVTCWGAVVRSGSNSGSVATFNIGLESEVDKNITDAPPPRAFNSTWFNASFIASSGAFSPGNHVNDAAFLVNNFAGSGGFQAGFVCPKETTANAGVAWACIYAASRSPWAIDIGDGTWSSGQIRGVGWSVDGDGAVTAKTLRVAAAAPTISACGTSPPPASPGSSNSGGQITFGAGAPTACSVTFASAYPAHAYCTVTPASAYAGTYYVSSSLASGFTVTLGAGASGVKFNYACNGN